jgi:hypothetical protein
VPATPPAYAHRRGRAGDHVYDLWGGQDRAPLRRLPALLLGALRLVRAAGPRDALLVVVLQGVAAAGTLAQLLVGREVLDAVVAQGRPAGAIVGLVVLLTAVTATPTRRRGSVQRPRHEEQPP